MSAASGDDRPRLPVAFWVYLVVLVGMFAFAIVQALVVRSAATTAMLAAFLGALVVVGLVVGAYALSVSTRVRRAQRTYPGAVTVPIVVGRELAAETGRLSEILGDPNLRLRNSTYAVLAFDRRGMHLVTTPARRDGEVTAIRLAAAGTGVTTVGARSVPCLVLVIRTDRGDVPLPVVPMRLRNPLRLFSSSELEQLGVRLGDALTGRSVTGGWTY